MPAILKPHHLALCVLIFLLFGSFGILQAQRGETDNDTLICCNRSAPPIGGSRVVLIDDLEITSFTTLPELLNGLVPSLYSLDIGVRNDLSRTVRLRGPSGLSVCPSLPSSRNWTSLQCPGPIALTTCTDCGPKILLDGIEIDPAALSTIAVIQLESVEVIPGPQAALKYGEGAASGAILLHSRPGSVDGIRAGVDLGGMRSPYVDDAEERTSQGYHLTLGSNRDQLAYHLSVQRSDFAGHAPAFGWEATNVGFGLSAAISDIDISAFARYSQRRTGLPGWSTAYYHLYSDGLLPSWGERIDDDDYADFRSTTFGFSIEHQHSRRWRSRVTAGSDLLDMEVRAVPTLSPGDSMTLIETERHSNPGFRASTTLDIPVGATLLTMEAGVDGRQDERLGFDSYHQHANQPRVTHSQGDVLEEAFRTVGGYAEARARIGGGLLLSVGGRVEEIGYEVERIGTSVSPRVAAAYEAEVGSWRIRPSASWARGYAAPSRLMLSGSNHGIEANPELNPQPTDGLDLAIMAEAFQQRLSLRAGIFRQTSLEVLGEIELAQGGKTRRYLNSPGSLTNSGQELSIEWRDAAFHIAAGASRLASSVDGVGVNPEGLPVSDDPSPETLGYTRIRYSLEEKIGLPVYAGASLRHLGRRWANDRRAIIEGLNSGEADFERHRWFAGINRADVFLGGRLRDAFEARLEVMNVADHVDQEVPEVVLPGRQFRLSLTAQI